MTTYWLDFNRGNDLQTGNSQVQAWRNLKMLENVEWQPGDVALLADDSEWYLNARIVLRDCNGTPTQPILFDRYSPSGGTSNSYPILRCRLVPQSQDWTYDNTVGAWYYSDPNGANLSDIQGTGVIMLGPTKQHGVFVRTFRQPFTPIVGPYQWTMDPTNRRYYLYAPRNTNPTEYYSGVLIGIPAEAQPALMFLRCGSNVLVRGIKFQECGNGVTVGLYSYPDQKWTPSDIVNFQMLECVGYNVGTLIRLVADYTPGSFEYVHRDPVINGNRLERCATAGIRLLNVANPTIKNNIGNGAIGRSWAIGFIYVDSSNSHPRTGGGLILANQLSRASHATEYHASDNTFDGAAIYCDAGSRGVQIRGNVVTNCHTAFQDNAGRGAGNTWVANIVDGCGRAILITDSDGIGTGFTRFVNNLCVLNGGDAVMPSVTGVTGAVRQAAFFSGRASDSSLIANNIFTSRTPSGYGVRVDPSLTSYVQNNIISGIRVPYSNTYGATLLNGSNVTSDPLLLDINQPQLGLATTSPASGAGLRIDGLLDCVGRPFGSTPNIGPWAILPK